MNKRFYWFYFVIALFFTSNLYADAQLKIGVVDVSKLVQESPQAKAANKILSEEFKPQEEQIRKITREIVESTEEYKRNRSIMTEQRAAEIESELFIKERNLKRLQTDFQEALSRRRNLKLSETLLVIRQTIVKVSHKNNYDLVLYLEGNAAYVNNRLDITSAVLDQLQADHQKAIGQ